MTVVLLTILGIFSSISLVSKLQRKDNSDQKEGITTSKLIEGDYLNGNLTKDKYLQQLLFLTYDQERLDQKYLKGNADNILPDIFSKFPDDSSVTQETKDLIKKYVFDQDLSLRADKTFDSEGKLIRSNSTSGTLPGTQAYAASPGIEKDRLLDQRIYSKSGEFVIWFTEKGENKVSKTNALKLANEVDRINETYSNTLSLNNSVKFQYLGNNINSQSKILKDSEGRVPVYLINSSGKSDLLAFYTPPMPSWVLALFPIMNNDSYNEVAKGHQIFPYIQIKPNSAKNYDKLKAILSHELVHLAHNKNCNWDFNCWTAGPENNFTKETTAQWLAAEINPKSDVFFDYIDYYFKDTSEGLLKANGYNTFTLLEYLENFADKKILFNSHKEEKPLRYLNLNINDFPHKFAGFAANNILKEYKNSSFINKNIPTPKESKPTSGEKILSPTGIHYYYLKTNSLKNQTFKVTNTSKGIEGQYLTVLAKKQVSLENFSDSKGFTQLYQDKLEGEFIFVPGNYKDYSEIAIIFSNGNVEKTTSYRLDLIPQDIAGNSDINKTSECRKIGSYNSIFQFFSAFPKALAEIFRELAKANSAGSINVTVDGASGAAASNSLNETSDSLEVLSNELTSTGSKQGNKGLVACRYDILATTNEQGVHEKIYNSSKGYKKSYINFKPLDKDYPNDNISLFSKFSFSEGFNFVFIHTNYSMKNKLPISENKETMGEMVNFKFDNLNQ